MSGLGCGADHSYNMNNELFESGSSREYFENTKHKTFILIKTIFCALLDSTLPALSDAMSAVPSLPQT